MSTCSRFFCQNVCGASGEIKAYKGTKYQTVDARYADGWAYNPTTRRWVKVACQQKKNAMEALPALLVGSST